MPPTQPSQVNPEWEGWEIRWRVAAIGPPASPHITEASAPPANDILWTEVAEQNTTQVAEKCPSENCVDLTES